MTDLTNKCGSCSWYDSEDKCSVGCRCTNPNKKWRCDVSAYRPRTVRACKLYEKKDGYEAPTEKFIESNGICSYCQGNPCGMEMEGNRNCKYFRGKKVIEVEDEGR